jgi:hypothetical protein
MSTNNAFDRDDLILAVATALLAGVVAVSWVLL